MFQTILLFLVLSAGNARAQVASYPLDLPNTPGPSVDQLRPGGRVAWLTGVMPLSDRGRENDFPSMAGSPNGDVWVVWSSYASLREEIRARRYSKGTWYAAFTVPGVSGDIWHPQVGVDAEGRPWFVWAQLHGYPRHTGETPNWDLYAARHDGDRWVGPLRLTDSPQADINHRLRVDAKGDLHLVWQGFRGGQSEIFYRRCANGQWGETVQVSSDGANDWFPDVALSRDGALTVVWDSYRKGNYDVYLRHQRNGQWTREETAAETLTAEMNASAVYDAQGRLWLAYEDAGVNWSKDTGGRSLGVKQVSTNIGAQRFTRVKVWSGNAWVKPKGDLKAVLPPGTDGFMSAPQLHADAAGRVWLLFRHRVQRPSTWTWGVTSEVVPNAVGLRVYWSAFSTHYDGDAWKPATEIPRSRGRASSMLTGAPAANGQFWMAWHTDNRDETQVNIAQGNEIWSCVLTAPTKPAAYQFEPWVAPEVKVSGNPHPNEVADVAALREFQASVAGKAYRLFKGDLHRHTELSTDGGGRADGSAIDFFRYMIDVAQSDFGAITDHRGGVELEYWWWLVQKLTDMYQVPGRYISLFGYERTPHWPNGHKNIIHAARNIPVVNLFFRSDIPEHWSTYAVAPADLVENDTPLLYSRVRESGGIAIPHTLGTSQGNDWKYVDDGVQPVAEVFQGARASYEHEGAPGAHVKKPNVAVDPDYNPTGFLWKAWEKGVRIGTIASSDHGSTHVSFAMVYSSDATRDGIVEAIRRRRTYGATDNILLEFRVGEHWMGEEFTADRVPEMKVKVRGTGPIAKVSLIRNGTFVYQNPVGAAEVDFTFQDRMAAKGVNWYYVRVEQADGMLAWSSPVWVEVR
ncbi:MAG: hypothetical protein JST93_01465 [Acidobacteria bacterium]|nr:hypothetical protein [Acidobacteriota bacterium]